MSVVRRLVYVSGAPGSGKTSLAIPLAAELGYALLTKDIIKETLHDALDGAPDPDRAWSRQLGGAAMELLVKGRGSLRLVPLPRVFRLITWPDPACGRDRERFSYREGFSCAGHEFPTPAEKPSR